MPLIYKKNILDSLKEKGYTTYKLRNEKLLSESTIQKLRQGEGISWENIETLCRLMNCDISDICAFVRDEK